MGTAGSSDMKAVGLRQICLLCRSWLARPSVRSFASIGRTALALWPLWAFSASCLASETPAAASQRTGTTALSIQGGTVADLDGDSRPDLAIVEAEGWGPRGFQYRIVLDLTTRGAPSSF